MRLIQHIGYHLPSHGPEPEIAALICAFARVLPVRTFVDVGANMGYYTWLLRDMAPRDIDLHMVEPDPGNIDLIRATISRSPNNVTLHPVALGPEDGELPFYLDADSAHRGSLIDQPFLEGQTVVAVRRFDDEFPAESLSELVLVKIDVEGGEEMVLAGADAFLRSQPIVVIECYCGDEPGKAPQILRDVGGYRLLDAVSTGPVTTDTKNYLAVPRSVSDGDLEQVLAARGDALRTKGRRWAS